VAIIKKRPGFVYKVPERPNMWYIFENNFVQGYQKLYTGPSDSRFGIFFWGMLPLNVLLMAFKQVVKFSFTSLPSFEEKKVLLVDFKQVIKFSNIGTIF